MPILGIVNSGSTHYGSGQDPYRGVVFVLLVATILALTGALAGGLMLANPVLLDTAVTMGITAGILVGIAVIQSARMRPLKREELSDEVSDPTAAPAVPSEETPETAPPPPATVDMSKLSPRLTAIRLWFRKQFRRLGPIGTLRIGIALAGFVATGLILLTNHPYDIGFPSPLTAGVAAALCLVGMGAAAVALKYLAEIDALRLPEAQGLCRAARVILWIFLFAAISVGLQWMEQETILLIVHLTLATINVALCYGLLTAKEAESEVLPSFPLAIGVLSALGNRTNILGSILDAAESQLGIDLRSTWALTLVRRSLEPLIIGLCVAGGLSTSLTVVPVAEEGLVERLGVPVSGQPLLPGIHIHWPWPIDRVFRISVQRVLALTIGHEGEEEGGPEDVLWARQHAANEYTLVLGNGRDLITIDAAVQYRIKDPRAWRYHTQNPADALRAIAYRAVMRSTVNLTLSDALSQNVVTLTNSMRGMVQNDANALGIGVDVIGFTVGGMHPPVPVAADYEAVVSAELGKVTAIADAQSFRNRTVPAAEAFAVTSQNTARAESAQALALAAGEAWSFRLLESQYHSSPEEYFFRRRLETLENNLAGRRFTVVDARFQRDGGELWSIP